MEDANSSLEERHLVLTTENIRNKERIRILEKDLSMSIKKDEHEDNMRRMDEMKSTLDSTRAAMLSYKNMSSVVSE